MEFNEFDKTWKNIFDIAINKAYSEANTINIDNKKRSSSLILALTTQIREALKDKEALFPFQNNIIVFSRKVENVGFECKEFLFDIHVCKIGNTNPLKKENTKDSKKEVQIPYIQESLVIIESEFSDKNIRDSIYDFSKLVVGNAKMKIMVLPLSPSNEKYLVPLEPIASNITGNLYAIFIPHPREWEPDLNTLTYKIYRFKNNKWHPM